MRNSPFHCGAPLVRENSNPANIAAHPATTGPVIWRQTRGALTHFVAGLGTTGTMMGAGGYLKARDPAIELVGVQPSEALHGLDGLKHMPTAIVPAIYDPSVPDRQEGVESEEAFEMARWLARKEGLLAGNSTGAALVAALRVGTELAERGQSGRIVVIAPDGGGNTSRRALGAERAVVALRLKGLPG